MKVFKAAAKQRSGNLKNADVWHVNTIEFSLIWRPDDKTRLKLNQLSWRAGEKGILYASETQDIASKHFERRQRY